MLEKTNDSNIIYRIATLSNPPPLSTHTLSSLFLFGIRTTPSLGDTIINHIRKRAGLRPPREGGGRSGGWKKEGAYGEETT